jgi:hypothetical protein
LLTAHPEELDFVFTVRDNAANEAANEVVWPAQSRSAHWGLPDPAALQGTAQPIQKAFREASYELECCNRGSEREHPGILRPNSLD